MSIQKIYEEALDIYLKHREDNPDFTFAVRQQDRVDQNTGKKRLSDLGYYFQGNDYYVFTSPYQPGDSVNMTKRVGFEIHSDSKCLFSVVLKDIYKDIENGGQHEEHGHLNFYKKVIELFDLKKKSDNNAYTNQAYNFSFEKNVSWQEHLTYFLDEIVPKINQIAKDEKIKDDYLFISEKKFDKNISKVLKARKSIKEGVNTIVNGNVASREYDCENKHPLNQILYGSAGTGKTYHTINHALAIINNKELSYYDASDAKSRESIQSKFNELRKQGRIEFVTFHQNFAYEDFIEGIKPVIGDEESSDLTYKIEDGIFKRIAIDASNDFDDILDDFSRYMKEKIKSAEALFLFQNDENKSRATISRVNFSSDNNFVSFTLGGSIEEGSISLTKDIIMRDIGEFFNGSIENYEQIQPKKKSQCTHLAHAMYYFPLYGMIKAFYDAEYMFTKNYVLIIDEINRGNIAKIFGELITLIEPSKRLGKDDAISATLPYSKKEFSVPPNLYIIGTMNTSDRSIALLDTALRRRFNFIEMMPDPKLLNAELTNFKDVDLEKLLTAMNNRIRVLLDREHQIGHTYFLQVKSLDDLRIVFQNQVMPLLQEYFYGDWVNIDQVLNKNGFIIDLFKSEGAFKDTIKGLDVEEKTAYELAPFIETDKNNVWNNLESYIAIIDKNGD